MLYRFRGMLSCRTSSGCRIIKDITGRSPRYILGSIRACEQVFTAYIKPRLNIKSICEWLLTLLGCNVWQRPVAGVVGFPNHHIDRLLFVEEERRWDLKRLWRFR